MLGTTRSKISELTLVVYYISCEDLFLCVFYVRVTLTLNVSQGLGSSSMT